MKIFELVQTAKSPITQEVYIPSDSDIGISINIKDNETNLLPTSIFDENDNLIEEAGYIDAEMTIPYYKIHSKPEGSISKIKVEYTVDDESGKQVPMEFTVNINSTKSGFSYVAQVGGSGSEVTKEYVDTNLEKKQNVITDKNAGTNVTITNENGVTKINATDTKPDITKAEVSEELAKKQDKLDAINAGTNIDITTDVSGNIKINSKLPDNFILDKNTHIELTENASISSAPNIETHVLSTGIQMTTPSETFTINPLPKDSYYFQGAYAKDEQCIVWSGAYGNSQTATLSADTNEFRIGNFQNDSIGHQGEVSFYLPYNTSWGGSPILSCMTSYKPKDGNFNRWVWGFNTETNKLELVIDIAGREKRFEVCLNPIM